MVKVHVERTINIPLTRAWPILADFSNVQNVHPLVHHVEKLSDHDRGVDAKRTCHFYDGGSATERITNWDDASHQYTVQLEKGTLPTKSVFVTFKASEHGQNATTLVGDADIIAKYGIFGKILEYLVIKRKFGGIIGNVFAGVEHFANTGEEVQRGFQATTPALVK